MINPDGVVNQIEGGAIQAASWTLKEQVRFDRDASPATAGRRYPILRFSEVPAVRVHVIDRPDEPTLGAGEAAQGPVAAAIANAVFDALACACAAAAHTRHDHACGERGLKNVVACDDTAMPEGGIPPGLNRAARLAGGVAAMLAP